MKKTLIVLLALCLMAMAFTGCAPKAETAEYDIDKMALKIKDSGAFSDMLSPIDTSIVPTLYGANASDIEDVVVLCSTGATTEEIAIFKCIDSEAAERLVSAAEERIISQKNLYGSYAPAEPPKLDEAIVKADGIYVFYIVSVNSAKVQAVLEGK
ncbi:MAG: DUF4358 domain-containing protein [Clostridiales bacterium]|nr:DUF4358 domain-containing protein [Clostridiales bacterium]